MVDLSIELPEHFLDEEVRCDYLVSSQMKEVWAVELDLLVKLLEVCKKHDIKIMAFGGTLLGAVRHGGFIPWDDDMDLIMKREDYNKLCEVAESEFKYPYFFQTKYTDEGCQFPAARLRNSTTTGILPHTTGKYYYHDYNQGIFIDILPYDNVISEKKELDSQIKKMKIMWRAVRLVHRLSKMRKVEMQNKVFECCRVIFQPLLAGFSVIDRKFGLEKALFAKFEDLSGKYDNVDTEMVDQIWFRIYRNIDFRLKYRKDFEETIEMPFEFIKIPVPMNYDRVLKMVYGDYMKMVRGANFHGEVIFDTSRSYLEYYKEIDI